MRRPEARDGGTLSLELALLTPVLVLFMLLLVMAGRIVDAKSEVDGAARDAARAASVARSAGEARTFAVRAARESLGGAGWCVGGPSTSVDLGRWGPGGRVAVTVRCNADMGGLSLLGMPGTHRLTGDSVAPIDTYTYRGGS